MKFRICALAIADIAQHYMVEPLVAGMKPCKISITHSMMLLQNNVMDNLIRKIAEHYKIDKSIIRLEDITPYNNNPSSFGEEREEHCPHCGKLYES